MLIPSEAACFAAGWHFSKALVATSLGFRCSLVNTIIKASISWLLALDRWRVLAQVWQPILVLLVMQCSLHNDKQSVKIW
jgi:hypothetical protein